MKKTLLAAAAIAFAPSLSAQFGNGCNGDLLTTPMHSGSNFTITVKGAPFADYLLAISASPGPTSIPGLGLFSIDAFDPNNLLYGPGFLSATGEAAFTAFVPNDPFWNAAVFYAQAIVLDLSCPTLYAITPGVRLDFEPPDSFTALPSMASARSLGTATLLKDGRVFVAGGGGGNLTGPSGTNTTELYQPFTRTWSSGPNLSIDRAFHEAVRLNDGRVLIVGGVVASGLATNTCEIFDPSTGLMSAAGSMNFPRGGFTATLLSNGKVLATGGVSTFQIPAGTTSIAPILASAQDTGEIYDPATNAWTNVPGVMASKRLAHTATSLQNGKVLLVSGINGSTNLLGNDVPTFTQSCNLYNPTTNAWEAAAQLPPGIFGIGGIPGRAGHRATLMNNGEVFVAGGVYSSFGVPTSAATTARYTPGTNAWTASGSTANGIALQGQVLLKNGQCHISGGATGTLIAFGATADCQKRSQGSSTFTTTTPLPLARGTHLAVLLRDGTVLIAGGGDAAGAALSSAELYTPSP